MLSIEAVFKFRRSVDKSVLKPWKKRQCNPATVLIENIYSMWKTISSSRIDVVARVSEEIDEIPSWNYILQSLVPIHIDIHILKIFTRSKVISGLMYINREPSRRKSNGEILYQIVSRIPRNYSHNPGSLTHSNPTFYKFMPVD